MRRRLRSHQGGAVVGEALVVLPVLLLLYVGVFHMNRVQVAALSSRGLARACAWRYANAGCRGGAPPGCEDASSKAEDIGNANDGEASMLDAAAQLPMVGWAFEELLGRSTTVTAARKVKPPPMFGDDELSVGAQMYLLCNERNRTMREMAKDTACSMLEVGSFMHGALGCAGDDEWE